MAGVAHPRTVLVEFLGAFVRHHDDWAPVSALVALMSEVGLDEPTVRTLVSRLKRRGWLGQEKRDGASGYRLSEVAIRSLSRGDRIVWQAREHASLSEGWALVFFSVPEKERALRHLLRSRLGSLGFGNIGPGTWIAPAPMLPDALALLAELNLARFADVFSADYAEGQELSALVARGWDLNGLNDEYRAFVRAHQPTLDHWRSAAGTDQEAFRLYMLVLNQWRGLPFRDPGLPRELLGDDWAGDAAGSLFELLVAILEPAAGRHVDSQWGTR